MTDETMAGDHEAFDREAPPLVLIVILNWNNSEVTLASVASVLQIGYPNFRMLLIDNGSSNGSAARLRTIRDDRVELLELSENRGYTGGCNEGLRRALAMGAQYVWLLNSDALVSDADTLKKLVSFAESDPKIGLVSPRIAALGEEARITFCGGVCSMDPLIYDETCDPEQARCWARDYRNAGLALGTAMLIKSSVIREIGMLDERFFMYFEDIDYSYRSSLAGYRNLVDEESIVRHEEKNRNTNPTGMKPHYWYYMARNECRFWRKHLGVFRSLRPSWWAFRRTLRHMLQCRENRDATDAMLAGLWHGWINRGGPYRPEYLMPRLLAAAIWKCMPATTASSQPSGKGK